MNEFESDLKRVMSDLERARVDLLSALDGLTEDGLSRRRRGGWSVTEILHHVIGGELHYTNGIAFIRGRPPGRSPNDQGEMRTAADAVRMLEEARLALLSTLEGMDEDTFYELAPLTNVEEYGQTYSVLSVLENVVHHDREHTAQIREILSLPQ
jgi:uncharacterized damage-inducible protein DinB